MRAVLTTMRSAIAEARANRGSFWSQLTAMVLNDVLWIVFWVLFFRQVGSIRGWDRSRVLLLFAILTTAGGIVLGILSNARRIGQLVADGGLDAALALPIRPLPYLLVRRVDAVNIGDLAFGILLFVLAGHPTPGRTAIYLLGTLCGTAVLASFLVAIGSVSLYTGRNELGDLGMHAIIMLASYPVDIFGGATKALLYTAVPAAFVAAVPATLVNHWTFAKAAVLVGAAAASALIASCVFSAGLRRYTSSSVWTRA